MVCLRTSIFLGIVLLAIPRVVLGQQSSPGDLSGLVVDGASGRPIGYARVTLIAENYGVFPADRSELNAVVGARGRMTDSQGRYRFVNVSPGHYRLLIRRIGYRPSTLDLQLDGPSGLQLSVGLSVAPIRLDRIETRAAPADMFSRPSRDEQPTFDAAALQRWRRDNFVATDVQVVSEDQVEGAVTLGERDILRALRQLPGVSGRDDWQAEPWVRGAPAGHTRVVFDGLPIFNPVHSGGLSSSIDPDALSAAFLYPGIRPPSIAEGAAAVIDLRSRAAGAEALAGRVSASGSRLGASLSRRWLGGRVGTVVTSSRSWLQPTRKLARTADGFTPDIPNEFVDVVFRGDALIKDNVTLEVSGLWQRDWIDGFLDGGPANNRINWGSTLARATLRFPLGSGTFRQTVGFSRFSAHASQIDPRVPLAAFDDQPTQEPTDNALRYVTVQGEWVTSDPQTMGIRWRVGYELGRYRSSYFGAPPTPYSILTYLYTLEYSEALNVGRLWAERWWRPGDRWVIRAGIRGEMYDGSKQTLIEPYVAVRHDVNDRLRFSFATAQHAQYAVPLAPSGLPFGPGLTASPVWVLAPSGRALVSDVSTLGGDWWLDGDWFAAVHVYRRETDNLAITDPAPGSTDDDRFFVEASNDAWGTEVSIQKLTGDWTSSFAYTLGFSTYTADGFTFPAPTDRRHVFDISLNTTLQKPIASGRIGFSGAFSVASGAPFTRLHPGTYDCSNYVPGGFCDAIVPTTVEAPNAERAPWATGANVRIEWTRSFSEWTLGAHVQIQNVLNTARAASYAVDANECRRTTQFDGFCGAAQDTFVPGMRRHIEAGLRFIF